jgi:hypothetical protein
VRYEVATNIGGHIRDRDFRSGNDRTGLVKHGAQDSALRRLGIQGGSSGGEDPEHNSKKAEAFHRSPLFLVPRIMSELHCKN